MQFLRTVSGQSTKHLVPGGHYGGDRGLVADFIDYLCGKTPSISCTDIADSINGHLTVFAADKSVKADKPVTIDYKADDHE